MVLSGGHGSGKRTLIKVFLNTATTRSHVLWLNHLSLKTIESKDKLNSFLNSKTNESHKWLVIENLHKMSNQFLYTLYNILSSKNIIICVLESQPQVDLSSWAVTFDMSPPSPSNLTDIARVILKKERRRFNKKTVEQLIEHSNGKLCSFLFFLQNKYEKKPDLTKYSDMSFSYDSILSQPSLKQCLKEIYDLEATGYSHIDIAMQLYRYTSSKSSSLNDAIELGKTIEHLSNYEHDPYHLYACICKMHRRRSLHPT